jgi:hypothetical protein
MVEVETVELAVADDVDARGLLGAMTTRVASIRPCSEGDPASQSGTG